METTYNAVLFKVVHETKYSSIVRGSGIYKTIWNAVIGQVSDVTPDTSKEAY